MNALRRFCAALFAVLAGCGAEEPEVTLRIATYNLHLARGAPGVLAAELAEGSAQIDAVVRVIAAADPDILLVNELDYDPDGLALAQFRERLAAAGVAYAHAFAAPVNTGLRTGLDLDDNGSKTDPEDAQGWGVFEGQYGMALLSRLPIREADIRTYREVLWAEMPETLYPAGYFPETAAGVLRLSSKSHWDVPVEAGGRIIHLLASHPTPPVFDGPEDRNGRRNADEIRFWTAYIDGADWIRADRGGAGGLPQDADFVILGDLNSDPKRGAGRREAIQALLDHPRVADPKPTAAGDTATARWKRTGPLRVDYVLPSRSLTVTGAGIVTEIEGGGGAIVEAASDHRLVWVDIGL